MQVTASRTRYEGQMFRRQTNIPMQRGDSWILDLHLNWNSSHLF